MTAKVPIIRYIGFYLAIITGFLVTIIGIILIFGKSHRNENIVYSIPTSQKVIALTFDDGPHPVYTPRLLAVLGKYHVRATFFMIGSSMKKYPLIVKQVIGKGHAIGNHTYNHPLNLALCSDSRILKEVNDCEIVIKQFTGQRPSIFRPPRGLFNQRVVQDLKKNGYQVVLWSVCGNRRKIKEPRLMARRVIENIHPGDIILLHDGTFDSRWKDVEATRYIIETLLKKGYRFVTVPQLLGK